MTSQLPQEVQNFLDVHPGKFEVVQFGDKVKIQCTLTKHEMSPSLKLLGTRSMTL